MLLNMITMFPKEIYGEIFLHLNEIEMTEFRSVSKLFEQLYQNYHAKLQFEITCNCDESDCDCFDPPRILADPFLNEYLINKRVIVLRKFIETTDCVLGYDPALNLILNFPVLNDGSFDQLLRFLAQLSYKNYDKYSYNYHVMNMVMRSDSPELLLHMFHKSDNNDRNTLLLICASWSKPKFVELLLPRCSAEQINNCFAFCCEQVGDNDAQELYQLLMEFGVTQCSYCKKSAISHVDPSKRSWADVYQGGMNYVASYLN